MIEWYFSGKWEVTDVITRQTEADTSTKKAVLWYFDAASLLYEYAYQQWKNKDPFQVRLTEIKMTHSLMMRETQGIQQWVRRNGDIVIQWANIKPVYGALVDEAMNQFVIYANQCNFEPENICETLAILHAYFEATHPFEDGNGRVWRMLINYMLISHWYPSIVIKGTETAKQKYFDGLEWAEKWLNERYPDQIPPLDRDQNIKPKKLAKLIESWLYQSMDYVLLAGEQDLIPVHEIVDSYGYDVSYARQLVARWHIIAKKIGTTRYSRSDYFHKPLKKKSKK